MTEDERALKRLIRHYTSKRDWRMVEELFGELGRRWEAEQR